MDKNDSILIRKVANGFIVIGQYRYEPNIDHTADSLVFETIDSLFGWLRVHFDDTTRAKRDEDYIKQIFRETLSEESLRSS